MVLIKLLCNFIEITLRHGCSPVNVLHIFRTPLSENTSGWLLLNHLCSQRITPWKNCVSLSVDNTNVMICIRNTVTSRFFGKSNEICIAGCPCHLAHIAAGHANDGFINCINQNIEDVCGDAFCWFDKSTKRKGELVEYFQFCDHEYQSVLRHVSVRWLSLECCLVKISKFTFVFCK